jgi:hypothetical protein
MVDTTATETTSNKLAPEAIYVALKVLFLCQQPRNNKQLPSLSLLHNSNDTLLIPPFNIKLLVEKLKLSSEEKLLSESLLKDQRKIKDGRFSVTSHKSYQEFLERAQQQATPPITDESV